MVFMENKIKFSKSLDEGESFNTYSEHISSPLASLPVEPKSLEAREPECISHVRV